MHARTHTHTHTQHTCTVHTHTHTHTRTCCRRFSEQEVNALLALAFDKLASSRAAGGALVGAMFWTAALQVGAGALTHETLMPLFVLLALAGGGGGRALECRLSCGWAVRLLVICGGARTRVQVMCTTTYATCQRGAHVLERRPAGERCDWTIT